MKLPLGNIGRVLLVLYALAITSLLCVSLFAEWGYVVAVLVFVATQAVFVFGAGTVNLCKAVRRRRLIVPVAVASAMMAILVGGVSLAVMELVHLEEEDWAIIAFFAIVPLSWIAWGVLFYFHCRPLERFSVLKRLTLYALGGSLLSLVLTISAHAITSRRNACFAGLYAAIGIAAGVCVMLWTFGPGIVLLVLAERHRRESRERHADPTRPSANAEQSE